MSKYTLLKYIEDLSEREFSFGPPTQGTNGTVSGFFARYDRIADSYGECCRRGFLNESIKRRKATGHPFPLVYQHDLNQIIGVVKRIEDRPEGVYMVADFLNTDRAQEVRKMIKCGVVYQMSFAYKTIDAGSVTLPDGKRAKELRECELYEISITPIPAQPLSQITEVKGGTGLQAARGLVQKRSTHARRYALLRYIKQL